MKPNHKCDPARMALLYIRQQFICTTFKLENDFIIFYCYTVLFLVLMNYHYHQKPALQKYNPNTIFHLYHDNT